MREKTRLWIVVTGSLCVVAPRTKNDGPGAAAKDAVPSRENQKKNWQSRRVSFFDWI